MEQKRIAVVDDDEGILKILHKVFSKAGYEVLTLSRSVEAMEAFRRFRPDLAFIDLMMPGIDGISLCRRIKASPELSSIKVIIFSAKKFLADRRTAQQMGADAYFEKRFHYRELLEKARSMLLEQIRIRFWGVRGSPYPRHPRATCSMAATPHASRSVSRIATQCSYSMPALA
ncbi:MAG: response regulator transcription factor [Thermodesulfobacteriota bacterium]